MLFSAVVVIQPGQVGVRHAFGYVDPVALLPGIRFVVPWSSVERYSTREEQFPERGDGVQPPPQVVQAINNKIAQEQQIQTERHRLSAYFNSLFSRFTTVLITLALAQNLSFASTNTQGASSVLVRSTMSAAAAS